MTGELTDALKKNARSASSSRSATAIVINPRNEKLCEQHARYRSGTKRGQSEGNWTKVRVKQELLATIVVVKSTKHAEGLLDLQVLALDNFSTFRIDISPDCAIETREDATAPALVCEKGSYYYSALIDDFRQAKEQAHPLLGGELECSQVKDVPTLKVALKVLGLLDVALSDSDLNTVVSLVRKPANPYA